MMTMAVAKERILSEIRRLALESGGTPPGVQAFKRATGIKESDWKGRHWIRWREALEEAGYAPNSWGEALPETDLLDRLAAYVRELGRFPVDAELTFKRRNDTGFPSPTVFYNRFGTLQVTADALLRYARTNGDSELVEICESPSRAASVQTKLQNT